MLKVLEELGNIPRKNNPNRKDLCYRVQCDCGYTWVTTKDNYKKTNACKFCKAKNFGKAHRTHNEAHKTRLYNIWKGIRQRCNNPNCSSYKMYGAVGVTICKEWDDYVNFRDWSLANGYKEDLEIDKDYLCDKLNVSPKVYSPKTCRWITRKENMEYTNKNRPKRIRCLSDEDCKEIKRLREEKGMYYSDIAKLYNVSGVTISVYLKAFNKTLRT